MIERFEFAETDAGSLRLNNWLSMPRHGVILALGEAQADNELDEHDQNDIGRSLSIEPCNIQYAQSQMGHTVLIRGLLDGHDIEIACSLDIVQDIASHVLGPVDQSQLASRERAIILEHVFGGPIAMLERDFGSHVSFHWAAQDVQADMPPIGAVALKLDGRARAAYAVLHGNNVAADMFRNWVESCQLKPPLNLAPAIQISILFGATTLSLTELRGLEVGDTVLIDDRFTGDRPLRAVAGKALIADARFNGTQIEAISQFSPVRGGQAFRWMVEPLEGVQLNMNDTNHIATNQLGDMKVKLVFEVGRAELSVGEIERLGPGYVFQVSRATDGHVDVIAGGRVIGSGELVKIGDDIGVRLKRIAS